MAEHADDDQMTGQLIIVAAPSGAGKTSLVQALLDSDPQLRVSISYTTRDPRPGEVDGVHYHFIDRARFQPLIDDSQALLEHAEVHGHHYGTGRDQVEKELRAGHDVLLEIDWQGARQVRERMPRARSIFVLPPSRDTLLERLTKRGQDSAETIARRVRNAREELQHAHEFDFLVVNDDFVTALSELRSIIVTQRLHRAVQQVRLRDLLAQLVA
jgi:guanylate kinase